MTDFTRSLKSSSARMAAGVLGQIINTLGQIAVVPLFLLFWSKREYGEWIVLTAIPNLLWSVEGGLGWLAINQMVLNSAVGDWKAANRWFNSIFIVQVCVSALMLATGVFFVSVLNILPMFNIVELSQGQGRFVLITMLIYMLFGWGIALLRAPYFASELSARGTMLTNCWKLSDFLVICAVLLLHGHACQLALAEMLVAGLWAVLGCIDLGRKCPQLRFRPREVSWKSCRAVFRDGTPLFLSQAADAFYIQGYPLIIGWTLGTLWVVNFTAIRTVTRVLLQGILILTRAAAVELASSLATKRWELYLRWVKIMAVCIMVGGVLACIGLRYLGPGFIAAWTHGQVTVAGSLLLLFGISVTLQAGWSLFGTMLYSANKHHIQCCCYFVITLTALWIGRLTMGTLGFGFIPILMITADGCILVLSIWLSVVYLREVRFQDLLRLFNPLFYWGKIVWAVGEARAGRFMSLPNFGR